MAKHRKPKWRPWHIEAARLLAGGAIVSDVAQRVQKTRQSVHRLTVTPGFSELLERAKGRQRAEAAATLEAAHPEALGVMRMAMLSDELPLGERVKVASEIAKLAAPVSERQRQAARAEILRALPPALRAQVVEALAGADKAWLDALTDAELEALAQGQEVTR